VKVKNFSAILFLLFISNSCSSVLYPTPMPTPTLIPTTKPLSTLILSPTPYQKLLLSRPVSNDIPVYHVYGSNQPTYSGFHPGFDYGFNTCDLISEGIIAMGKGTIIRIDVDDPHPAGKNGTVRIDYGVHLIASGEKCRIIAQMGHIVPAVSVGDSVDSDSIVAYFSTCERYGYSPELEVQILCLDAEKTENINEYLLDQYLSKKIDEGIELHINPELVGLKPE